MFEFLKKKPEKINATEIINVIENAVYDDLKTLGFRKYGRTLHRFVEEDISQIINFQCGQAYREETHLMWVNVGIRIPECEIMSFEPEEKPPKYYHDYNCNMRSRLGVVKGRKVSCYDLHKSTDDIISDILKQIKEYVILAFDILNNRANILKYRRKYPHFDTLNSKLILLEEAMIFGRMGDLKKASELFNQYYHMCKNNRKPQKGHLEYLDELAVRLGIELNN